jgi:hypothetical protein
VIQKRHIRTSRDKTLFSRGLGEVSILLKCDEVGVNKGLNGKMFEPTILFFQSGANIKRLGEALTTSSGTHEKIGTAKVKNFSE